MTDTGQYDYFRDYGDGTFRTMEFWVIEKAAGNTTHQATTILEWKHVSVVQGWPEPSTIAEEDLPEGPKCLIVYYGREMKLLAPFTVVAKCWQQYRQKKRQRKQNTSFPPLNWN